MPAIDPNAPRLSYKAKNHNVTIPSFFAVGHALNENETRFANRMLAATITNAFASQINRLVKAAAEKRDALPEAERANVPEPTAENIVDAATAQEMIDKIYSAYEIGVVGGGGAIERDPVETIANNIAWERIKEQLKKRNIKVSSVKAEHKAKLIAQMHDLDPSIRVQAQAAYNGSDAKDFGDMFSGLDADEPAASTSGAADTVAAGSGSDTVAGGDTVPGTTAVPQGTSSDAVTPGDDTNAAPAGVDNPGQTEVAPDASAGEATPPKGAFA